MGLTPRLESSSLLFSNFNLMLIRYTIAKCINYCSLTVTISDHVIILNQMTIIQLERLIISSSPGLQIPGLMEIYPEIDSHFTAFRSISGRINRAWLHQ